jgi:hypothetical protein
LPDLLVLLQEVATMMTNTGAHNRILFMLSLFSLLDDQLFLTFE